MITIDELLMGRAKFFELDSTIQANLLELSMKINIIRKAYGQPMTVSSGYRTAAINASTPNAAPNSKHMFGQAVDIRDADGSLWTWVINNLDIIKKAGLWLENPNWTHNSTNAGWVHFQILAPNSGHRIFIPSSAPAINPNFWDGEYDSKYDLN